MIKRCGQCNNELKVEYKPTSVDVILKISVCPNHGETTDYIGTAKMAVKKQRIYGKCIKCQDRWFGENPVCLACRTMEKNEKIPKCERCKDPWYGENPLCVRCRIADNDKMKAKWRCQLCKENADNKLWSTSKGLVCEKCRNEMKGVGA